MATLPAELRSPPWNDHAGRFSLLKAIALALMFAPAGWMLYKLATDAYWPRPLVGLVYDSGVWATWLLLFALFVTPLRRILRWQRLILVRRMIGVAAVAYTVAHMIIWFALREFEWLAIMAEMASRLTLVVATVSFIGLMVLAATSFDAAVKRMGARGWNRLHRTVYVLTALAVLHFLLSPGAMAGLPFLMAGIYFWLMSWRYLDRRGLGESIPALFVLGIAAAGLTVILEALWAWMLGRDMDPWMVLGWNFSLILGLSPGWRMLIIGLAVALAAQVARKVRQHDARYGLAG